ncbi:hypothetical protein BB559_004449 [Furculomyces boomerangus]|uniref:Transcription elongation factor n=2 Tax=Harpellales TaxID=61421 RepID=A0A2T9YEJ4_9FUNG|nr:hypothetical protein BB559_004449 [Furculomyces boomerangus]
MAVGKLRSDKNEKVSKLAKSIVQKWKKNVTEAAALAKKKKLENTQKSSNNPTNNIGDNKAQNSEKTSIQDSTPKESISPNNQKSPSPPSTNKSEFDPETGKKTRSFANDGVSFQPTGDKIRDKSIEMLYNALVVDSYSDSKAILARAVDIENAEIAKVSSTNQAYKSDIRSFYLNLKDPKNPNIRSAIIEGNIKPSDFVKMTPEEMASEERKNNDLKIQKENLFKAQGAGPQEAETDMFRCSKCGSRKCRYYQLQTRSADEPMTTFVSCTYCGKRWKFC